MIDSSIYLQVDATVIAGILILLTIGSAFKFQEKAHEKIMQRIFKWEIEFTLYSSVLVLCMPFALSAIFIITDDAFFPNVIPTPTSIHQTLIWFYQIMTGLGFAYILWIVLVLSNHEDKIRRNE